MIRSYHFGFIAVSLQIIVSILVGISNDCSRCVWLSKWRDFVFVDGLYVGVFVVLEGRRARKIDADFPICSVLGRFCWSD